MLLIITLYRLVSDFLFFISKISIFNIAIFLIVHHLLTSSNHYFTIDKLFCFLRCFKKVSCITIVRLFRKIYTSSKIITFWRKVYIKWLLFILKNILRIMWASPMVKIHFSYLRLWNLLYVFFLLTVLFP